MSEPPEGIDERHHRAAGPAVRVLRGGWIALITAILAAGLLGVFGQTGRTSAAEAGGARLELDTASAVRGGLFFQARIDVRARQDIEHPRLVLDEGWLDGLQINSIEPAPQSEASRDGRLVLSYPGMRAGDRLLVSMHFQVEPTRVGFTTDNGVELDDGRQMLVAVDRRLRRMP